MLGSESLTKWLIVMAGAAIALCLVLFFPSAASAQPGGPPVPAGPCGALQQADFSSIPGAPASIMSTQIVSATDTQPEYCEVYGLISSQIQFKLWLPTDGWNERYLQVGCGGYCGSLDASEQCYTGLAQNFAVGFDNSGHLGGAPVGGGDALWGYDNLGLRQDFGYRSEHVTAAVAKAVVAAFYDQDPAYSYYFGCSNGGRQALQEAQRWPEDFDGIIAGAPAAIQAPLNGEYEPWNGLANTAEDGSLILQQAQFQLLNDAALANCDAADGLADQQITDPRRCDFDPGILLCREGEAPPAADMGTQPPITGELSITGVAPLATTLEMTGAEMTGAMPAGIPSTAARDGACHLLDAGTARCRTQALQRPGHGRWRGALPRPSGSRLRTWLAAVPGGFRPRHAADGQHNWQRLSQVPGLPGQPGTVIYLE